MRFFKLLHQGAAKSQMSMGLWAVSQEPSLHAFPKRDVDEDSKRN